MIYDEHYQAYVVLIVESENIAEGHLLTNCGFHSMIYCMVYSCHLKAHKYEKLCWQKLLLLRQVTFVNKSKTEVAFANKYFLPDESNFCGQKLLLTRQKFLNKSCFYQQKYGCYKRCPIEYASALCLHSSEYMCIFLISNISMWQPMLTMCSLLDSTEM